MSALDELINLAVMEAASDLIQITGRGLTTIEHVAVFNDTALVKHLRALNATDADFQACLDRALFVSPRGAHWLWTASRDQQEEVAA